MPGNFHFGRLQSSPAELQPESETTMYGMQSAPSEMQSAKLKVNTKAALDYWMSTQTRYAVLRLQTDY